MELKQELKLKQTLSQKMIQSANILQMGQIELKEYIEEMALENPVVDLEEREPENGRLEENGELNEKIRRFEELASLDRQNQTYYQDEEEEAGRLEPGRSQEGLLESLLEQACMLHLTKREEKIFRYMIKNLDASGYLSVNFGRNPSPRQMPDRCFRKPSHTGGSCEAALPEYRSSEALPPDGSPT